MDEYMKREFWRNIIIGAVVVISTIILALWLSEKVVLNYDPSDSEAASRMVLVFGIFILMIYSIILLLARFVVYLSRSYPDSSLSQSAQHVTGHWLKWLMVLFVLFCIVLVYIVTKSELM